MRNSPRGVKSVVMADPPSTTTTTSSSSSSSSSSASTDPKENGGEAGVEGRRVRALKNRSGSLGSSIIASKGGGNVLRRPTRGECVATLRVILYDLKLTASAGEGNKTTRGGAAEVSTCDSDLQYGCILGMGNKDSILPPGVFVPLPTQPTCLGSHVNLPVQTLESKLRVTVVDTETDHALGVVSIPLKDIPFVHESMAFGLANYYHFKPKPKDGVTPMPGGMLRIGLKLLKQRNPTRKLGEWRGKTAGGNLDNHTWVDNPQYWLSVSVRSIISVNLQSTLGNENQIGFYIIKIAELNELVRKRKALEEDVVKRSDYFSWLERGSESVSKELYILPGSYIIVPCVKYPGVEGVFQLTVVGDYDAGLKIDSFDEDQLEGDVEWLSSDESSDVSSGSDSSRDSKHVKLKVDKKHHKEEKRRQQQQALLMKYGSMGNVNRLKLTLEKTRDVNTEGISALTFAARNGHFDCVSLLVGKGADINKTDTEGFNALLMAAMGGHVDVLKFLLSHKEADVHARDPVGNTALPLACTSGSLECVDLLLEKGALVNQTNDQRQTPLMRAAASGHADIVTRLIKKGAKTNAKDTSGQTALHYACTGGSLESVKLLLDHGSEISEKDRNGETALFKASFRGHLDILRLLIEKGEKHAEKHGGAITSRGMSSHFISQKSKMRDWDTITLLLEPSDNNYDDLIRQRERERRDMKSSGEEGGSDAPLVRSGSGVSITSGGHETKKLQVLDVLIVLMKHGNRRSAFQLISTNGSVKSSNLILEREEEESDDRSGYQSDGSSETTKGSGILGASTLHDTLTSSSPMSTKHATEKKDKKDKKKDKKSKKDKDDKKTKEKAPKKEGVRVRMSAAETDPLVEVIAKGQLEIMCLLIEKGDMGNYLQNMSVSTLLYDVVDHDTFQCLFQQFESVLKTSQEGERNGKKRLKRKSISPRKDANTDDVRQLSLAMLSPPSGPFGCVLTAVDGVRITIVNCIDADSTTDGRKGDSPRTPRGTSAVQSSMRRFMKAGHMDLLGVLFNTRRALLSTSQSIQTRKKSNSPRQLFVWIREGKNLAGHSDGNPAAEATDRQKTSPPATPRELQATMAKDRSLYCELKWCKSTHRTSTRKLEEQQSWFERFHFDLGDPLGEQKLEVTVFEVDKPEKGSQNSLGRMELSLSDIMREANRGKLGPRWFDLHKDGTQTGASLCLQLNVQLLASGRK